MTSLGRRFSALVLVLLLPLLLLSRAHAAAGAYEAELPAELATARDLCALVPCKDVFPGATHFSERKGQPPYVEAYDQASEPRKLLGYVMLSTDITDTPAYSGKPVVTLIGMDTQGRFVGVKVLKHSSPSCCWAFLNRHCSTSTPSTWASRWLTRSRWASRAPMRT